MADDQSEFGNDDLHTPHLPERYRKVVRAKQRRRRNKIILACAGIIAVTIVAYLLVSGITGSVSIPAPALPSLPSLQASATPAPSGTGNPSSNGSLLTDTVTRGPGLAGPLPAGSVPLDKALAVIREEYPDPRVSVLSADYSTDGGRPLFVFRIRSSGESSPVTISAFIDAMSGSPYSPGEENAKISRDAARIKAWDTSPMVQPDRIRLEYLNDPFVGKQWNYVMYQDGSIAAAGSFDADSGEERASYRYPSAAGRPAAVTLDMTRAQAIAEQYIADKNGGALPLNLSLSRYNPVPAPAGLVAGWYVFTFQRTCRDVPAETDGFTVVVDAVSGDVTGYAHQWTTPEYAFAAALSEPDVIKREATYAVMQKAKETYPADVSGIRIISTDLLWKNRVLYGTVPRPGSIPLAWRVVFDDDVIRANTSAQPAVAWVDAHSGAFLEFDYRHI